MTGINRAGSGPLGISNSTGQTIGVSGMTLKGATNSVLLVGDSMLERSFNTASATGPAVDNGDRTATLTFSATPLGSLIGIAVGDPIRVNNSSTPLFNQLAATVTAVNGPAKTATYTITGPFSSLVGADPPFTIIPKMLTPLSMFALLNDLLGGELEVVSNCAQGGARLEQISQVFDALAIPARFGIFLGGRNNFGANSPPDTLAQIIPKAKELLDKMVKKCVNLIIIGTPPQLYGDIGTFPARAQIQQQYEDWLAQYAASVGGYYVNAATASSSTVQYRDATSTTGVPSANFSPDGTHQSGISSYAVAKAVAAAMRPLLLPTICWPSGLANTYANDPSFVFDNTLLQGTGGIKTINAGTITGTVPDSLTIAIDVGTAAVTLSQIARTTATDGDTAGNWLRLVIINASGASTITIKQTLTVARVQNGDTIRALSRTRVTSSGSPGTGDPIALVGLEAYCRTVTATDAAINETHSKLGVTAAAQAYTEGYVGALVSPWVQVRDASHGAVSSGFFIVEIDFNGAGGATIDIAHPHIRKKVL